MADDLEQVTTVMDEIARRLVVDCQRKIDESNSSNIRKSNDRNS